MSNCACCKSKLIPGSYSTCRTCDNCGVYICDECYTRNVYYFRFLVRERLKGFVVLCPECANKLNAKPFEQDHPYLG